jgi:GSH-dependent disulfide-bond oxidoreductase
MIRFHYNLSPNPMKVALCLEELGLPYEPVPVDTPPVSEQLPPG